MQLPEKLIKSLSETTGFDEESFIKIHQCGNQLTSIRINPSKHPLIMNSGLIADEAFLYNSTFTIQEKVPWSSFGYYLSKRPAFTLDPLLHAGAYYVQEASSMFLEQAFKQTVDLNKSIHILDLCAAPGGKSTLIQSLMSEESLLVSNEAIKTRANILVENISKWGASNVIVTNNDPKDFATLENYFDVIVVDAPCSGSGLFRKDPDAIKEWSEENVTLCSHRQQRILADIMPALKQNGIFIYATCSYSKEENEDILDWIAEKFQVKGLRLMVDKTWGIMETLSDKTNSHGYRFYPDKVKGEGFFIAVFQKKDGGNFSFPKRKKNNFEKLTKNEEAITRKWITDNEKFSLFKNESLVYAIPEHLQNHFSLLKSLLYIKKAGVLLGKITPHELIPEHELALSKLSHANAPSIELSTEQAISYLRKEEIKIETQYKGWCTVTYQQHQLGWIKVLPNRINNYYPSEWRIRM